jgi:hypothetical protein
MKYIIFIFGGMEKQDEFVNSLCDNIILNIDVEYIKFFYSDSSCVYTFKSNTSFDEVSASITNILHKINITYFLLPYSDFEINVRIDEETLEHLFGKELDEDSPSVNEDDLVEPNTFFSRLDEALASIRDNDLESDMDIDIIPLLKKKKHIKTLDEILDQISQSGITSLSDDDKKLLEKYANS